MPVFPKIEDHIQVKLEPHLPVSNRSINTVQANKELVKKILHKVINNNEI